MRNGIVAAIMAAVLLPAVPPDANAQNLGKILVPSNVLRLSANTERSGTTSSTTKQFIVPYAGTVRIRWQIKSGTTAAFANINVSSQIANCTSGTLSKTYVGGSCTLFVVAGDLIRVFVTGENLGGGNFSLAYMRNVRVYYNVVNSNGTGTVLND